MSLRQYKVDAAQTAFYYQQLLKRSAKAFSVRYEELLARSLFPLLSDGPSFADDAWVYQTWDGTGEAAVIGDYADDLPTADAFLKENLTRHVPVTSSVIMNFKEMQKDRQTGTGLLARKQERAVRAVEQKIHKCALFGDDSRMVPGFLTNPNLPAPLPAAGDWAAVTSDAVLDDLHAIANAPPENTLNIETVDTMIMPLREFHLISTRRLPDSDMTIRSHFMLATPYIKNITVLPELITQDAALTGPRVIAYRRDENALALSIPMNPQWMPSQEKNLTTMWPLISACGGVIVFLPQSISRMDGMGA